MVFNFDGRNIKSFIDSLKTIVSVSKEDVNAISDLQNYIKNNSDDDNFAINLKNDIISLRTTIKDPQLIGYIDNLIEKGEEAKISLSDAFTFKYGDNTKGFKNVSQLIKDFNALGDSTGKATEAQKELAQWTKTSNSNLGKYFSTVKDGKASWTGYAGSLVSATVKTIALETATVALNAAISFGISFLIQALITGISNVIHYEENLIKKQEELRESAKNLTEQYKSAKEAADKLNKSSGDLINRYAKLAQGVDALGNNVSLTNEEYEEYKNLCNQIADDVPNLIKAYDDEGNAILTLRDNVNALKTAYQEAAKEKYSALLNSDDINKALEGYSKFIKDIAITSSSYAATGNYSLLYDVMSGDNSDTIRKIQYSHKSAMEMLQAYLNGKIDLKRGMQSKMTDEDSRLFSNYQDLLNQLKIEFDLSADHTNQEWFDFRNRVSTELSKLKLEYSTYQASLNSLSNAILHIYDGFYNLPSELQTISNAVANNLPDSLTESLTGDAEEDKAKIATYIYSVVDSLNNPETSEQVTEAYKQIFSITKEDLPVKKTLSQVQGYVDEIIKATGMDESSVRKIFGLDEIDNISRQLDNIKQRFIDAFSFGNEEIRGNFFNGLLNELSDADIPNTTDEIKALAEAVDEVSQAGGKSTDVLEVYRKKISSFSNFDSEKYNITETTKQLQEAYSALIEFRRTLSDDTKTTQDVEKSVREMAKIYENNAEVKLAAEKYFTTHTKESAQEFLEVYKNAYLTDQNNFNAWLEEKRNVAKANENDKDAWDKFSASDFVEVFKDAYGIDLTNYTSYLDMKSKLTQQWLDDNGIDISKIPSTSAVNQILQKMEDELNLDEIAAMYGSFFDSYTPYVPDKADKKGGSSNDPIKDAFQKEYNKRKHWLEMGKDAEGKAYTNDDFYAWLDDREEGYKHYFSDLTKYQDEYWKYEEEVFKYNQTKYGEDADKRFDDLADQYKKGKFTAEQYAKAVKDLGQELYGENSLYGGTEFAKKKLEELDKTVKEVSDDIYSEFKESLGADGDRLLDDVLADADKLTDKNIELFSDDPKTYKKNVEDIFKSVADIAKDYLERGLITPERFKEIIDKYGEGLDTGTIQDAYDDAFDKIADKGKDKLDKMLIAPDEYFKLLDEWGKKLGIADDVIQKYKDAVSESDYLDRWDLDNGYDSKKSKDDFELRKKRIEYIYELAEKLYGKDGQKDLKAYNALINQGLEDVESLVEDYYDKEIEKLEKINDEEEKREKALELQLNLIKARQKLEDAKKQKNQLVFHNGTFEYMEDQEAVKSAQEDVLEAEKAILEQQVEDQKEALEERKKAASEFFNKVEGDVSGALERIEKFLSGDTSVYEKAPDKKDKDNSSDKLANRANSVINSITDLSEPNAFEKLISLFGGKPTNNSMKSFMDSFASTLIGKQIIPTTIRDAITNNSNTTNNNNNKNIVVDVGDIHITVPEGMSKEDIAEYVAGRLSESIALALPKYLI